MKNYIPTIMIKHKSSSKDLCKSYIKHVEDDIFIVSTFILTENPKDYFNYTIVRKYLNKFLIKRSVDYTYNTWKLINIFMKELIVHYNLNINK